MTMKQQLPTINFFLEKWKMKYIKYKTKK